MAMGPYRAAAENALRVPRRKADYPLVMECPLILRESVGEPGSGS